LNTEQPNQNKVHPRIRGEDIVLAMSIRPVRGSPPHTRGRCRTDLLHVRGGGFTPAYAGKIKHKNKGCILVEVHPRIRGEDKALYSAPDMLIGSPPHTRGRYWSVPCGTWDERFTPAYAGKMSCTCVGNESPRVHPRIRGEDQRICACGMPRKGSPPHTRGRYRRRRCCTPVRRFTPAYAGKIQSLQRSSLPQRVHPRIRGEDAGA